jgi:hypothetical protein|tara:strand:- start:309 stop:470 length:162 start_codon:yes stop_codon:yes gene_type:complete
MKRSQADQVEINFLAFEDYTEWFEYALNEDEELSEILFELRQAADQFWTPVSC